MSITVSSLKGIAKGSISLPSSKSESNRILILSALSGGMVSTENLSQARDTKILQAALDNHSREINIQDAGTAMRFLTAYYCAAGQHKVLTGSARMCERPIAILVAALRDIGFRIEYLRQEGFPPIEIFPADPHSLKREVSIAGNVSSQYISALMMIAPVLEHGLVIHFTTALASRPYIELTRKLLGDTGIVSEMTETDIRIAPQKFRQTRIQIAADWSSASYWFTVAALAQDAEIVLEKLSTGAAQGDKKIAEWSQYFGIIAEPCKQGLLLHSRNPINPTSPQNYDLHLDFTDHPDLAQTVIVLCAAKNIRATLSGLGSLRIKETDRIAALQNELQKFSVKLEEMSDGGFQLSGGFHMSHQTIKTYGDHRMAMAFAPLALLGNITIENPEVVEKSYPTFWEEMMKVGFDITQDSI